MPEGHLLHRIARDQAKWFANKRLQITSPQGRFVRGAKQLSGTKLLAVEAYGKHLIYRFSGKKFLHVHLGLYGKFRAHFNPPPEPRGAVRIRMIGRTHAIDLNGPNQCELLTKKACLDLMQRIGADPLRDQADADGCCAAIGRSRAKIGALLLNQAVISGIGNIFRSEILHRLGIHPNRRGCDLSQEEVGQIWETAVEMMRVGVKYNRIITKRRSEVDLPLGRLPAEECLLVYKRESCWQCDTKIEHWELGGRKVFACLACQRNV